MYTPVLAVLKYLQVIMYQGTLRYSYKLTDACPRHIHTCNDREVEPYEYLLAGRAGAVVCARDDVPDVSG